MSRQILFVALLFHASTCISQQEILLIGTHHITASDRLKEIIPIARAVESFRPGIICVEYPIGTDTASIIQKSTILTKDAQVIQKMEALRKEWKIPSGDMSIRIDSLLKDPDLPSDVQKRMELQQLYFLSSDAANADYQGYLIMTKVEKNALKAALLRKHSPGFQTMKAMYEIKRDRNDEYYHLVFPLAAKLNTAYLYPIDDLSSWKEYEKYYDRLQVRDTTDVSKMRFRQFRDNFLQKVQFLPRDSNQWLFSNSPQIIHDLLYVEAYKIDADITNEDIKMLHYYWVQRNKMMAQHIDAVASKHPHSNVAVFFGASHIGAVQAELNKLTKNYKVLTLFDMNR